MFIYIYSVRGEIDQISTNTFRYSTCCAANIYIFVYIFIEAPLVPLMAAECVCSQHQKATIHQVTTMLATSKNVLFPGHNHLLTTSTDDSSLAGAQAIIKVSG